MDQALIQHFNIVIADDEPILLNHLRRCLAELEDPMFSVIGVAHDGIQALNLILEYAPDFAILDIQMPNLTGLEVVRRVKQAQINTEFILLSGYDKFSYAKEAITLGVQAYLLKPLDQEELYQSLHRICSNRTKTSIKLPQYQESASRFLNELLTRHSMNTDKVQDVLSLLNLQLSDRDCYSMVIQFDGSFPLSDTASSMISAMDSVLQNKHHAFLINNDLIIGIFNTSAQSASELARLCADVLRTNFQKEPYIAIGDIVPTLQQISYSHNRALTALTYRLFDPQVHILSTDIICTAAPTYTISDFDYQPLMQSILKKDFSEIRAFCAAFFHKLMYVSMPPPNYVLGLCANLVSTVEQKLLVIGQAQKQLSPKEVFSCNTISEVEDWLCQTFSALSEDFRPAYNVSDAARETSPQLNPVIRITQEYIQQNVHKNLLLEDIAQQVHLSPSYLAIYYKKYTNNNIREYILEAKMEDAKRQLDLTNASVNDVADSLGYSDYRSFSRAFKKLYGVTPSEYRSKKEKLP